MKEEFVNILFYSISGAAGGGASFLFALKKGHYKNNRFISKLLIELLGSSLTSGFLSGLLIANWQVKVSLIYSVSFIIGLVWAGIIQILRNKVTAIAEAIIGDYQKKETK